MRIAVFTTQTKGHTAMQVQFKTNPEIKPIAELATSRLERYVAVFILGNPNLGEETALDPEQVQTLWQYAAQGGRVYAEMIEAFDFSTSRLFGWKQEYARTVRTQEKLLIDAAAGEDFEHGLLEWAGGYQRGARVFGETWLHIGTYRSTHTGDLAGTIAPGLITHELGQGRIFYAAFPLIQAVDRIPYRPYWRWTELFKRLDAAGCPVEALAPPVRVCLPGEGADSRTTLEHCTRWFASSGILPEANGSGGVYENIHSVTGQVSKDRRPDCHAHAALMFHLYGRYTGEDRWHGVSEQLMDYILHGGYQDLDPSSASYGFFKWYEYPEPLPEQIFTDDNAWVAFVLLYLYRKTGDPLYKERGLLVAEALLSTQQHQGLRSNCLLGSDLREHGKEKAKYSRDASMNPHFESIAHAAYIQAYLVSGDRTYLDTALEGSRYLLEHMEQCKWMYSRTSGMGRFLLPLTYLAKHDETGRLAAGLQRIVDYLREHQHSSGAVEEADNPDPDKYGKEDTGIFRFNGEGIADQLYTNNFLLMNVWEAWKQTGNVEYRRVYDQVSSYLRAIQARSDDPKYDGGWMRAFDLTHWEYFGNNGDTGWGPYCIESGWTQAMIGVGLVLEQLDESLFSDRKA